MNKKAFEYGLSTHKGNVKDRNEDRAFISFSDGEFAVALIADGMGGYQAGEAAAQLAVDRVKAWWVESIESMKVGSLTVEGAARSLEDVFHQINDELIDLSREDGLRAGTTLSVLLVCQDRYLVVHVGDSRIYQLRDQVEEKVQIKATEDVDTLDLTDIAHRKTEKGIRQLTEDHSWVETQVKQGLLSKEEARLHPRRNVLLQCLGVEGEPSVFVCKGLLSFGSVYLLCSDGFYSLFSDQFIRETVERLVKDSSLQKAAEEMVKMAKENGATDNITVVLLRKGEEVESGFRKIIRKISFGK